MLETTYTATIIATVAEATFITEWAGDGIHIIRGMTHGTILGTTAPGIALGTTAVGTGLGMADGIAVGMVDGTALGIAAGTRHSTMEAGTILGTTEAITVAADTMEVSMMVTT